MIAAHPFLALLLTSVVIPFLVLSVVLRHYSRGGERDRQVVFARQWYLLLLVPLVWIVIGLQLGRDGAALWDEFRDHGFTLAVTLPLVMFAWMFSYYAWVWVAITTMSSPEAQAGDNKRLRIRKRSIVVSAGIALVATCAVVGVLIASLIEDVREDPDVGEWQSLFRLACGILLLFFAWGLSMGWADGSSEYGRRAKGVGPDSEDGAQAAVTGGPLGATIHGLSQLMSIGFAGAGLIILFLVLRQGV